MRGTRRTLQRLTFAQTTGATYFHPFADPLVVAGQGTLGLEILDDLPDIDTILVAIGGGGLISGLGDCGGGAAAEMFASLESSQRDHPH